MPILPATTLFLLALLAVVGMGAASANAQTPWCDGHWIPGEGIPGTKAPIHVAAEWDPDGDGPASSILVVGGEFTWAGNVTSIGIAAWNGETWQSVGGGITAGSRIDAITVFNGELIACGTFTSIGGQSATNIARFDGTAWRAMGTGLNAPGRALVVWNGDLYAGGDFTTAGGAGANRIAKWNGNAWEALGTGLNSGVTHLVEFNGMLIAAGSFTTAGSNQASKIAQWDGAAWSPVGTGTSNTTVTALFDHDGKLLASGLSGSIPHTDAWNGTTWTTFGDAGFGPLYGFAEFDGSLIGCRKNEYAAWNGVVSWDGNDWHSLGYGIEGIVYGGIVYNGELYVFGDFNRVQTNTANNIARLDAGGPTWWPVGSGMNDKAGAFTTFEGDLIVGGTFIMAGGVPTGTVARLSDAQWLPMSNGLSLDSVADFEEYNGSLYVGGSNNIFRWNGSAWEIPGGGTWGGGPTTLLVHKNALYVGGRFSKAGGSNGKVVNFVARWNGTTWSSLGSGVDFFVFELAEYNGDLIVAGSFSNAGGSPAGRIARWNGSQWSTLGAGLEGGSVFDMVVYNGELIVGGAFTKAGGLPAKGIARWNGTSWSAFGTGIAGGPIPQLYAVTVYKDSLVVGGGFTFVDGLSVNNIARWDGAKWFPLGSGTSPGNVNSVTGLDVINGDLLVGGNFTRIGGTNTAYFATWHADTPVQIANQPEDVTVCRTGTAHFTMSLTEQAAAFEWRKGGVPVDLGDPRITVDVSADGRTSTLAISDASLLDSGIGGDGYACTARNSCGEITSDSADLVVCVADFDCSGFVAPDDFNSFVASFEAGTDDADVDASGFVDLDDFTFFVQRFEAGC